MSVNKLFITEEPSSEYTVGGYCVINIGDILIGTYFAIRKIGFGFSSTVWLCWNMINKSYVVIKILKSDPNFVEITNNEVKLLSTVNELDHDYRKHVVRFMEHFTCEGINGTHPCIVFEFAGNILPVFQQKLDLNLNMIKTIVLHILKGLYYLHEVCDLIHSDLKPDNILVLENGLNYAQQLALEVYDKLNNDQIPKSFTSNLPKSQRKIMKPSKKNERAVYENAVRVHHRFLQNEMERLGIVKIANATGDNKTLFNFCNHYSKLFKKKNTQTKEHEDVILVKIADLGYASQNGFLQFDEYLQVREYRAAEVILGGQIGKPVDIWSVACMVFELVARETLFPANINDNEHLTKITQLVGDIPQKYLETVAFKNKFYDSEGTLLNSVKGDRISLVASFLEQGMLENEANELSNLLLSMLHWDPNQRLTVGDCLKHSWLNVQNERI